MLTLFCATLKPTPFSASSSIYSWKCISFIFHLVQGGSLGYLSKERPVREPHWLFLPHLVRVCHRLRESQHGVLARAGQARQPHQRGRGASNRARDIRGCNSKNKIFALSWLMSSRTDDGAQNTPSRVYISKFSGAAYPCKILTLQGWGPKV